MWQRLRAGDLDVCCDCRGGGFWGVSTGVVAALVMILGAALLPIGHRQLLQLSQVDPERDFVSLGASCRVREVQTTLSTERYRAHGKRDYFCVAYYTYVFTFDGAGVSTLTEPDAVFESSPERVELFQGLCEDSPGVVTAMSFTGSLEVGQLHECWAPVVPGPPPMTQLYKCGSYECIKVGAAGRPPTRRMPHTKSPQP